MTTRAKIRRVLVGLAAGALMTAAVVAVQWTLHRRLAWSDGFGERFYDADRRAVWSTRARFGVEETRVHGYVFDRIMPSFSGIVLFDGGEPMMAEQAAKLPARPVPGSSYFARSGGWTGIRFRQANYIREARFGAPFACGAWTAMFVADESNGAIEVRAVEGLDSGPPPSSREPPRWIAPTRVLGAGFAANTLAGAAAWWIAAAAVGRGLRASRRRRGCCVFCGYPRGTGVAAGAVCPECGRPEASGAAGT